jgi:hypothetical protein
VAKTKYVRVMTPEARLAFCKNLFEADDKGKYSCVLIFPRTADLSKMEAAAREVGEDMFGDGFEKLKKAKKLKWPFKNGEECISSKTGEVYPGFSEDVVYINVNTTTPPGAVDRAAVKVEEPGRLFYAGCYARATLSAAAFDVDNSKGVKFYLGNLQFLREGERLGGGVPEAEDEFGALDPRPMENGPDDILG